MSYFEQVVQAADRFDRREFVLDAISSTVMGCTGEALTFDEAMRILDALPDLHSPEFRNMPPIAHA